MRSFRVYLDGRPLDASSETNDPWSAVTEVVAGDSASQDIQIETHAFGDGYFLSSGTEHVLFTARRPESAANTPSLRGILERIAVDVCYCSIYGSDCDRALATLRPIETEPCPEP